MVEIRYKKSRNPRAADLRNTGYLYTAMQQASQIKYDLEKIAEKENIPLGELKPTVIPSEMLWFLADTYLDAYKLLMEERLIKSGNIHKIQPTLN